MRRNRIQFSGVIATTAAIALTGAVLAAPASSAEEARVGVSSLTQVSLHDIFGRSSDIDSSVQPDTRMMSVNPLLPQASLIYAAREPTRRNPAIRYGTVFSLPRAFDRVAVDPMGRWAAYVEQGATGALIEAGIHRSASVQSREIPTQDNTHDIVATPNGRFAIVLSNPDGRVGIDVVDVANGTRLTTATLDLGGEATAIAVSADSRRVFIATPTSNRGPAVWQARITNLSAPASWALPDWFDRDLSLAASADGDYLAVGSPTRHQVAVLDARNGSTITVQDLAGRPGPNGTLVDTLPLTGAVVASGTEPSLTLLDPAARFRSRGAATIDLPFPPLALDANGQGTVVYALGSPEGAELGRRILFIDTGLDPDPSLRANARRSGDRAKVTGSVRDIAPGTPILIQWRERGSQDDWTRIHPKPVVAVDGTFAWRGLIGTGRFDIKVSALGAKDRATVRIN